MGLIPQIMGIVNTTPDSFFPDSRVATVDDAIARGRAFFDMGCDIVDVGGESTRPGAEPVTEDEELRRVLEPVTVLSQLGTVSIDTRHEAVARAAVASGALIINDVSLTLMDVAAELGVGYVAMHAQGTPATMQQSPHYDDVVGEVWATLAAAAERARQLGIRDLWLDPGIGFGKTVEHNLALLAHVGELVELAASFGAGVLIGTSRKSFLSHLGPTTLAVQERLEGSLATEAWAIVAGVSIVRVHDVDDALRLRDLVCRPVEEVT